MHMPATVQAAAGAAAAPDVKLGQPQREIERKVGPKVTKHRRPAVDNDRSGRRRRRRRPAPFWRRRLLGSTWPHSDVATHGGAEAQV